MFMLRKTARQPILVTLLTTSFVFKLSAADLTQEYTGRPWQCELNNQSSMRHLRFLGHTTFGATKAEFNKICESSQSHWFLEQTRLPASLLMPHVDKAFSEWDEESELTTFVIDSPTFGFWNNAISAPDQLRQRMAFALSQILVISTKGSEVLAETPTAIAHYQDILIRNALGNYRTLLEEVTYAPAMGYYLTYIGSKKADAVSGTKPDENFARELLQLFTIGPSKLNQDGTPAVDSLGKSKDTYTNKDITELAKVFTGFDIDVENNLDEEERFERWMEVADLPMIIRNKEHSTQEITFLGKTIAENTPAEEAVSLALDYIFQHPNLAPFVSTQLIKRFTSSNPSPQYVERVARTFDSGWYVVPNGSLIGTRQRGDLSATLAAIIFDPEISHASGSNTGKVREPILALTHWARVFDLKEAIAEYELELWSTDSSRSLSQHPYRSPSVFNFFRPGYTPPGSMTAKQGLTAPEMQLMNASSIPGFANLMTHFIFKFHNDDELKEYQELLAEEGRSVSIQELKRNFKPSYDYELTLARKPQHLVEHLDKLLTQNNLSNTTTQNIVDALTLLDDDEDLQLRVQLATLMVMTSPGYLIQK